MKLGQLSHQTPLHVHVCARLCQADLPPVLGCARPGGLAQEELALSSSSCALSLAGASLPGLLGGDCWNYGRERKKKPPRGVLSRG